MLVWWQKVHPTCKNLSPVIPRVVFWTTFGNTAYPGVISEENGPVKKKKTYVKLWKAVVVYQKSLNSTFDAGWLTYTEHRPPASSSQEFVVIATRWDAKIYVSSSSSACSSASSLHAATMPPTHAVNSSPANTGKATAVSVVFGLQFAEKFNRFAFQRLISLITRQHAMDAERDIVLPILSVSPSSAGIVSERMNVASYFFDDLVEASF